MCRVDLLLLKDSSIIKMNLFFVLFFKSGNPVSVGQRTFATRARRRRTVFIQRRGLKQNGDWQLFRRTVRYILLYSVQ